MLFQHGIYTLCGAHKPITQISVSNFSDEEMKAIYESLSDEDKKAKGFSVDMMEGYKLSEAWEKWEQISHRFPMKRFMLFKQEGDDSHYFFLIFADVLKTAVIIQNNYEEFQKAIGFDFHPLELTLQMDQKDSVFWTKLNPYLYGLLFGFGETNSRLFSWKCSHPKSCEEFCKNIKPLFSNDYSQLKGHIKFTIDNFKTPSFMSFNEIDPFVNIYKEEAKAIKENYKGKDFLDLTLQKLTE